jgi:1-acyl-sn-glycerol-3-phosphate acyltransferase
VIPIWLDGAARALPKGAVLPRPYKVTVRFGPPLPSLQADPEDSSSWHAAAQVVRSAVFQLSQSE